jgi:hypothetical protein
VTWISFHWNTEIRHGTVIGILSAPARHFLRTTFLWAQCVWTLITVFARFTLNFGNSWIYKMRENFKTYQWMKCNILASYIHSHHLLLDNSSCPCRMKQDNELGIHIHCYQEGLAIKKISSCQIKQSLKLS